MTATNNEHDGHDHEFAMNLAISEKYAAGPRQLRPEDSRGPQGRDYRIWHRLANANKTPYRGPQGPRE